MLRNAAATTPRLGAERVLALFIDKWAIKVTQTLRNLENCGLVRREIVRIKPLNVRYSLTPLGRTFVRPLSQLCEWAVKHEDELSEVARRRASHKKFAPKARVGPAPGDSRGAEMIPQYFTAKVVQGTSK